MSNLEYITRLTQRTSAMRAQGISKWMLDGDEYVSPHYGVHRPAGICSDPEAMRIADAIGLMTDASILTGWAARWIQGQAYCDGVLYGKELPVSILFGPGSRLRPRPGIRPRERLWLPGEVIDLGDVVAATMARAAYDDMLDAPNQLEALVAVEMATSTVIKQARTDLCNVQGVFDAHVKTRGRRQARWALAHATTRSASPWETRTRVLATEVLGVDDWLVNVPVFNGFEDLLGIADLIDPDSGLVLESDGAEHRNIAVHNNDNVREEAFENHGSAVVRIGSAQHARAERPTTIERIRQGRERAYSMGSCTWTTDKPAWWWNWPPGRRWD
ncbi:MAG TPA: hypothetical protein VK059_12115 [Nocardioidaceae bacterium]|nr:hypothetical protein [Nocardioidaceae bacterium]